MSHYYRLGIDAGGTFTDFVLLEEGPQGSQVRLHKVLSTPEAPERAILQGISELGLEALLRTDRLQIIHGSTVATNAALEGKGAPTAFITNHGFGDMLTLGRQTRPQLYQLEFAPVPPPVPAAYCIEVGGRLGADGSVVQPLLEAELKEACEKLERLAPQAVAINLLFSFLDDRHERAIADRIRSEQPGLLVSRSSEVLPEYREYERGIATWLNASLGPVVSGYLGRLAARVGADRLQIMQSSGETIAAGRAADRAVNLLLSGPAAGLAAIRALGKQIGESRLLSFDMGGTSTDVALIDGELKITNEGRIAGFPVAVPMVDMHTIGAGGGSIAFLDGGGMLQVGPGSAGAQPGPACYGRGGNAPTVTDANLVLGRIHGATRLAGSFTLDPGAAERAIAPLAGSAGLSVMELAAGIIRIANEHMASALRMISVQRGYDPGLFTLVCFGGAGGLHVCELAEAMGMKTAIVPASAGVLSALGMLVAPKGRQFSRTLGLLEGDTSDRELGVALGELTAMGQRELAAEGLAADSLTVAVSLDMRYQGQSATLNVPWLNLAAAVAAFHQQHDSRYGFRLERNVEFVNLRVRMTTDAPAPRLTPPPADATTDEPAFSRVFGVGEPVPVIPRGALRPGQELAGPAIFTELSATTYLKPGWRARMDAAGNLRLSTP